MRELGRVPERNRYRCRETRHVPARVSAGVEPAIRAAALPNVDPFSDLSSVLPIIRSAPEDDFELNPNFREVPKHFTHPEGWRLDRAHKVQHAERIGILEARGTVAAVRHKLRALRAFGCKHLHLSDNLGDVLGFSKGRMCNFGLLACCRQLAALCLAGNVIVKHRWVPSEVNFADAASRTWERERTQHAEARESSTGAFFGRHAEKADMAGASER